jgi:hypothetical protein
MKFQNIEHLLKFSPKNAGSHQFTSTYLEFWTICRIISLIKCLEELICFIEKLKV